MQGNASIYIIYTPNLGLGIAVAGRKREQGRLRRSTEEQRGSKSTKLALAREQCGGAIYLKLEDTIYILYTPRT